MTRESDNKAIKIFTARACVEPLKRAAADFERESGCTIDIDVCSRHCASSVAEEATDASDDFLIEIADAGIHDLAIGGAEYLLDEGEVLGIVKKGMRRTIAYRESAIVVPADNPADIRRLEDLSRHGVRVAISMIDCLKGLWEDVTARLGLLEAVRSNITYHANGCIAIVEAVAEGHVDAAFGWTAFEHLAPGRIEVVRLEPEKRLLRGTCVGLLSFSSNPDQAVSFMKYLASPHSMHHYLDFGWVLP